MRCLQNLPPQSWLHFDHNDLSSDPFPVSAINGLHHFKRSRRRCIITYKKRKQHVIAVSQHQSPQQQQQQQQEQHQDNEEEEEEDYKVLTAMRSSYNQIVILDSPKSRFLLLDSTNNVHSMINKENKWTGSYWDEFSTLPPLIPRGPIAIFGLGGGTAARLMLDLWPSLQLEGWEIDGILVEKARDYLGLSDLEKQTKDGGVLNVRIGDVFLPSSSTPGGYAGIIVDLFSDGKVLPQLQEVEMWLELDKKLMPSGRFMVNCGGGEDGLSQDHDSCSDRAWELNTTIKTLCNAFPGQVNWKKMPKEAGENYLAMTGPLPDKATWSAALPDELMLKVNEWRTC